MASSPTPSRFRFRDHRQAENSSPTDTSSGVSSVSSDRDDEAEMECMTGKGIERLCSELLELKAASDEDFQRTVFSNYSAFLSVFKEVQALGNQVLRLKAHVSMQKRFVRDLMDGVYLKTLSEEAIESIIEGSVGVEPSSPNKLEVHINDVSETLDTLLSENRIDEALRIIEMEDENFQRILSKENIPSNVSMLYNSAMSEKKAMLTLQLTLEAENPRITAPELQKTLVGLCRLGDSHLTTSLLINHYHSRIASRVHNFQYSKSFSHVSYIRDLVKFVFSMISQAAKSFVMLYGETSPYSPEFIQWVNEETELFVDCFKKYVKSISEANGGLAIAAEAVKFAMSFCSLVENQGIVLGPCLKTHIHPCMEEIVQVHVDHFKKVIGIFAPTDSWVLGRYLVSGILNEGCSSTIVGHQPEYYLLTNSGRKLVTLLQAVTEDVSPLAVLQMEGPLLRGLKDLFTEYISILEKAITCKIDIEEKGGSKINLAETPMQQVSVLVNLSTLEHFLSNIIRSIYKGIDHNDYEQTNSLGHQQEELELCILFVQEASCQLRVHFCQQFVYRVMVEQTSRKLTQEPYVDDQCDSGAIHLMMPSSAFQVLFRELRKLDKLAENNVFEVDWLMELQRELIEAVFIWIANSEEALATMDEQKDDQHDDKYKQFVLDMQFLAEIAMFKGYFSDDPMVLVALMESAFLSAGLDPSRDVHDDEWSFTAAAEALEKLLEAENMEADGNLVEEEQHEDETDSGSDHLEQDAQICDGLEEADDYVDASVSASNSETALSERTTLEEKGSPDNMSATETEDELEDFASKTVGDQLQGTKNSELPDAQVIAEGVPEIKIEDEGINSYDKEYGIIPNTKSPNTPSFADVVVGVDSEMRSEVSGVSGMSVDEDTINQPEMLDVVGGASEMRVPIAVYEETSNQPEMSTALVPSRTIDENQAGVVRGASQTSIHVDLLTINPPELADQPQLSGRASDELIINLKHRALESSVPETGHQPQTAESDNTSMSDGTRD